MTEAFRLSAQEIAIKEQLVDYHFFHSGEELEEYLRGLGLDKDTPKLILWHLISNDAVNQQNEVPALLLGRRTVSNILEDLADLGSGLADSPNDFTVGLVIGLDDGNHLAIKYRSEEFVLSGSEGKSDMGLSAEREFDYNSTYEVAICKDYSSLLWHGGGLVESGY